MNTRNITGWILVSLILAVCATAQGTDEANGPRLMASGSITENGHYAEVGLEFSTWGDFIALLSPVRWKSPLATGGSLSWLNPSAWSTDAGRTGRILLGEAAVFGGLAAAFGGGGGGGSSSADASSPATPGSPPGGGTPPTPPVASPQSP